jgi:hypothetical protein
MDLYGLMITRDDQEVFADWCRDQLALYDAVVCLDGSQSDATQKQAQAFGDELIYLHERQFEIPYKTDHGLRRVVHREICRRFGYENWIMCCHADEFCYHDPRKIAATAEAKGHDSVDWFSLQFFPHPDDLPDWPRRQNVSVTERVRHYHWDFAGSGLPWIEQRLYRNSPRLAWDRSTHGSTAPHGLERPAPFHPILRHYKVFTTNGVFYEPSGGSTLYRSHWTSLEHRTGLAFRAEKPEDFFIRSYKNYGRCDRFEGSVPHAWNMGEEYRPDS